MKKTLDDWKSFGRVLIAIFMLSVGAWILGSSIWTGAGCNKNTVMCGERP